MNGEVWAWPTLVMTHDEAFHNLINLRDYTCRWRQWAPGGPIDFDPGYSREDRNLVIDWVDRASQ